MLRKSLAKVIGENIARRRRELGLTQMILAERLDIGQDALSRMEKGMISPKIARLRDVAEALECNAASLFQEEHDDMRGYVVDLIDLLTPLPPEKRDIVIRAIREMVKLAK